MPPLEFQTNLKNRVIRKVRKTQHQGLIIQGVRFKKEKPGKKVFISIQGG
jgi:hypothetical protein